MLDIERDAAAAWHPAEQERQHCKLNLLQMQMALRYMLQLLSAGWIVCKAEYTFCVCARTYSLNVLALAPKSGMLVLPTMIALLCSKTAKKGSSC